MDRSAKKRIAVVSAGHIPSEWAHSINTMKHADGFSKLDYEVEVLSPERYEEYRLRKRIKSIHEFYGVSHNITITLFRDFVFFFQQKNPFRYFYFVLKKLTGNTLQYTFDPEKNIAQYIKRKGFDVVYARAFRVPYYLIQENIPVIVEIHSPIIADPQLRKLLRLSHHPSFLGISTISHAIKESFIRYGVPSEKILVQEDAVDLAQFDRIQSSKKELRQELHLPLEKKILTYAGSLHEGKGVKDILATAKRMENDPTILFLLVGGPEHKRVEYEQMCRKKHILNVQFVGFVEQYLIPKYVKSADILLLLYNTSEKNAVMDLETTSPLKLFEYMASRVPIVASAVPTIQKVVRHNREALLAEVNKVDSVVSMIRKLLQDTNLYKSLTENAYVLAKNYTYKLRCERILTFHE